MNEELIRLTGNTNVEDWYSLAQTSSILGDWIVFASHWSPPSTLENPWQSLAEHVAARKQWGIALNALAQRPEFRGAQARFEAYAALGTIAQNQNDFAQAKRFYQQMAQEFPSRFEPWIALADIAIKENQTDAIREYLLQAETRGASQVAIGTRRSRSGIQRTPADLLKPTTIQ